MSFGNATIEDSYIINSEEKILGINFYRLIGHDS